jgi:hypothetical protein
VPDSGLSLRLLVDRTEAGREYAYRISPTVSGVAIVVCLCGSEPIMEVDSVGVFLSPLMSIVLPSVGAFEQSPIHSFDSHRMSLRDRGWR